LESVRDSGFLRVRFLLHVLVARQLRLAGRWEEIEVHLAQAAELMGGRHPVLQWHLEVEGALLAMRRGDAGALERAEAARAAFAQLRRPDGMERSVYAELCEVLASA
ncbi:MAG: hypothetical protein KC621_02470, partial [Myxococcales bacterium]|nr:hypothetical protein [Myxococcales bacterium]